MTAWSPACRVKLSALAKQKCHAQLDGIGVVEVVADNEEAKASDQARRRERHRQRNQRDDDQQLEHRQSSEWKHVYDYMKEDGSDSLEVVAANYRVGDLVTDRLRHVEQKGAKKNAATAEAFHSNFLNWPSSWGPLITFPTDMLEILFQPP